MTGHAGIKHCPTCMTLLEEYQYRLLMVDVCPTCHGMWLDRGELGALVAYLEPEAPADQPGGTPKRQVMTGERITEPPKSCPRCHATLKPFNYAYDSNIILDRCPACEGVWVDRGELQKIVLHAWHAAQGTL